MINIVYDIVADTWQYYCIKSVKMSAEGAQPSLSEELGDQGCIFCCKSPINPNKISLF